jgi:hypothetical protein
MGVLVCYDDFTYDVVNDYHLEYLLEKGCIVGYDSSGEWVKMEGLPPDNADPAAASHSDQP